MLLLAKKITKMAFHNIKSYTLSQNALQAIFAILSSFYNYLEQEEYTTGNPIAQIRQK